MGKTPRRVYFDKYFLILNFQVDQGSFGCIFNDSDSLIGHEILSKTFFFVRLQPGEIGLIVAVHPCHELDIRAVFFGQVTVPGLPELAVSPGPLFFTRRDMMIGNMQ